VSNDPTVAIYTAITIVSLAVIGVYGRAALDAIRGGLKRRSDMLTLGIVTGFVYAVMYYPYWIVWRLGGAEVKSAMVNHWFVPSLTALIIIGALLHIRAATLKKCGERGWIVVTMGALAGAATMYWFSG